MPTQHLPPTTKRESIFRRVWPDYWALAIAGIFALAAAWWLDSPHQAAPAALRPLFGPTIPNRAPAPMPAPPGMVWVPGGEFSMGAQDPPGRTDVEMKATVDARPVHRVYVDGFFMDQTVVTNAQFAEFVKTTGYVTV